MPTFYEDVTVGETTEYGAYEVTGEEVVRFAERCDPQWFHTDSQRAAEESPYGGPVASGWHTGAMTVRLIVEGHLSDGATGVDELRFPSPGRPGDGLHTETGIWRRPPTAPTAGWSECGRGRSPTTARRCCR